MNEEDIQKIISGLAEKLKPSADNKVKDEVKPESNSFSPDDFIDKLLPKLEERFSQQTKSEIKAIKEESFKEKLEQKLNENPYFKTFLEDEDDYGKKRVDYINSIDIEDRAEALSKIESRFKQAMSASGEGNVTIKKMVNDEIKKHEDNYADLDKKLADREISSMEYTDAFVESVINEMDSMSRH